MNLSERLRDFLKIFMLFIFGCLMIFYPLYGMFFWWKTIFISNFGIFVSIFLVLAASISTILWWLVCGTIGYVILRGLFFKQVPKNLNIVWLVYLGPIFMFVMLLILFWLGLSSLFLGPRRV